jgi:hypothetical protein
MMEKMGWTDHMKRVIKGVKEQRNILHTVKQKKANWIGHRFRRNCLLKHRTGKKDRRNGRMRKKTYVATV